MFQRNCGIEKFYAIWGVSQFFVENFLSHSAEKIWGHPFNLSEKLGYRKLLCTYGVSQFYVEKILSHSAEKFRKGILLFLRKFLVSESFLDEKARITFLLLKILVSQCRKISRASPQCFRKIGVLKKSMLTRGYHVFFSKLFCPTVPKNFMGIPSIFQKIWGVEKFHALMGYHIFPSKVFCLTVPKNFVMESYCFWEIFWFQKLLWMKKGVSRFCV